MCSIKKETFDGFVAFAFRSPHGFADTDMCSMLQQLRRESENMCGHRGLLPNSEHQTFCFLAPLQLRYSHIFEHFEIDR